MLTLPTPPKRSDDRFRKRLHDIVFSHLPRSTSKEAQASHRLADAIAADLVVEMALTLTPRDRTAIHIANRAFRAHAAEQSPTPQTGYARATAQS